jgi:hypothetical protein
MTRTLLRAPHFAHIRNVRIVGLLATRRVMRCAEQPGPRRNVRGPEWYDELDVAASRNAPVLVPEDKEAERQADRSEAVAYCYLQVGRLQFGSFDTLSRYETALWRQCAQLMFLLQSATRR